MVYTVNGEQFTRRRKITFTNPPTINNYQCRINLDTCYANMNSDFSDIRFTDLNGNVLYHNILEKTDGVSATVDVLIPNQESAILMYYGNPNVTDGSDPENVYLAYFDGDLTGWTEVDSGGYLSVSNGHLKFNDLPTGNVDAYVYTQPSESVTNLLFEYTVSYTSATHDPILHFGAQSSYIDDLYNTQNYLTTGWFRPADSSIARSLAVVSGTGYVGNTIAVGLSTYYITAYRNGDTVTTDIYSDPDRTTLVGSSTFTSTAIPSTYSYIYLMSSHNSGSTFHRATGWIDDFVVRKYLATEPTPVIGREEHQRRVPQFM